MNHRAWRFFVLIMLMVPLAAQASFYLKPVGLYERNESGGYARTETIFDLSAGYMTEKGWLLGGIYTSNSSAGMSNGPVYGPTLGWSSLKEIGPFVMVHYYVPKSSYPGVSTEKTTGFQGDVGLKIAMRKFSLAVQMSYRKYIQKSDFQSFSYSFVKPALGLFLVF